MKKGKPKITKIIIPQDRLDKMNARLSPIPKYSDQYKNNIKQICIKEKLCRCGEIPTKLVSWDVGDASLVERYCNECFNKNKDSL